jgi:hypothetical protein
VKIVIDTNVWISFLIGKILGNLKNYILDEKIRVITSEEQIEELVSVLRRPKFKEYFTESDIEELLFLVYKTCQFVEIKENVNDCRDKRDNFILEIAINGEADYIITGDQDLMVLNPYRGTRILSFHDFEDILNQTKQTKPTRQTR